MYKFRAFPLETQFTDFAAVFFVTGRERNSEGRIAHSRIYCGQSGNMSVRPFSEEQSASFKANHANCICILPVEEDTSRVSIELDIHKNYRLLSGM